MSESVPVGPAPSARHEVIGATTVAPGRDVEVECITLEAGTLRVEVLTYGAHLVGVWTPDRHGRVDNLVASLRDAGGRPDLERYRDQVANPHLGSIIGRYANRIGGARFELDGEQVQLLANEGDNQLHGGPVGFDRHVWSASSSSDERSAQVSLRHVSSHGDQGYPGTVEVQARYVLDVHGGLRIELGGSTDAPTVLNMTNHAYWNLAGTAESGTAEPGAAQPGATRSADTVHVGDHLLRVEADRVVVVDQSMIPTGELRSVTDSVFDLRDAVAVGRLIDDPALVTTKGMDHCLVFPDGDGTGPGGTAELHEPGSGRRMVLRTDQPGVQVYTSNHGAGDLPAHSTICLETQALPDAPNQPAFPSTVLRPGERYRHVTELRFAVVG